MPPDCGSLPFWRTGLKIWLRDAGNGDGSTISKFADVDAAIRVLETMTNPDGSANVGIQRVGTLAREQFEYANTATRVDLMRIAPAFGFSPADVDESLWRASRIAQNDLSGVWPLPTS